MFGIKKFLPHSIPHSSTNYTYRIWWNLLLITIGSFCVAVGTKSLAVPHQFIPSGIFGLASLLFYSGAPLSPGWLYALLNAPLFLFAWFKVSKRFFWYSAYAVAITTVLYELCDISIPLESQLYASVASGLIAGFGAGVVLRSLGSNGGLDVVAVFLFQRFNIGIGRVYLLFNTALFSLSLWHISLDLVVASLIMVFVSSVTLEQTLSLFSQRKVVFIVSEMSESISRDILSIMDNKELPPLDGNGKPAATPTANAGGSSADKNGKDGDFVIEPDTATPSAAQPAQQDAEQPGQSAAGEGQNTSGGEGAQPNSKSDNDR